MEVIPDPTTVHFHLPNSFSVQVHREYGEFVAELTNKFPHEKEGILKFYGECWKVCFIYLFVYLFLDVWLQLPPAVFASTYNLLLTLRHLCTYWVDFQCLELIGIEVTWGANLPFWTIFSEASRMLDAW